jgi:5-methylcytosine-specific restriction endonuclease McrA
MILRGADLAAKHAREQAIRRARRRWNYLKSQLRPLIFERDHYTCQRCGLVAEPQKVTYDDALCLHLDGIGLVVDHMVPLCAGGVSEPANLQTLCWTCNSIKGGEDRKAHPSYAGVAA